MKKNLLYMLIAAAMISGCTKNDVVDSEINKDSNLIGFSTYKNISRGNPVDNNEEFLTANNTFGVTAFIKQEETLQESPYMGTTTEGVVIISDGSKWNYKQASDQAYWPTKGEILDFYAYTPLDNSIITNPTFNVTKGLTLTYTVPNNETAQKDLMYAVALNQQKPENSNSVTMPFKHALTQVHFKIGTSAENLYVDVAENGIRIYNLKSTGTLTTKTGLETEVWNNLSGQAQYSVISQVVSEAGYEMTDDGTQKFTSIGSADQALMLLPQKIEAWSESNTTGAYLTISCKIYQKLANGTKIYLHGSADTYAEVKVGISNNWVRNQKITYNLNIGATAGVLTPIEFVTEVETWSPIDKEIINVK